MTTPSQSVREAPGIHSMQRIEVGQYPKPLLMKLSLHLQV
jgi:hypothetical protein